MNQETCYNCSHPAIMKVNIKKISSQISLTSYYCKHCASQVMGTLMEFKAGDEVMKDNNLFTILMTQPKEIYEPRQLIL